MKKGLILPVLALALAAGACDEDDETTGVGTQANVRFVNAISGVNGNLALTANGSMVGSSLGFGSVSSQCTRLNAGSTALAFGTANTGGTGISGTALFTQNQTFNAGGDYTVIATGTSTNPRFVVLDNDAYTGTVASGQTAVRFVNLVPTVGTTASNFNVFTGTTTTGTPTASSVGFGNASNFSTMTAGSPTFTFTNATGGTQVFSGSGLNLASGSVNTVAILPNSAGTGYQLVNITGC
jgi:hypothetical protein